MSTTFQLFSVTHLLALSAIAAATALLCRFGRRTPAQGPPTRFEIGLALLNLFVWVMAHAYWMLPPQFEARTSLPLQLCHLAALAASASLLTGQRVFQALVYYWGLGLSTQALITPSLEEGPAILWFWVFWQQHGIIPAVALYELIVHRYRPGWHDFRIACVATAGYLAVVLPVDVMFGLNYGFVGPSRPEHPSIIDLLGPWPQRLVVIVAIVAGVMALMTVPWTLGRQRSRAG